MLASGETFLRSPSFSWVPAHQSLEEALQLGIPVRWWVGNLWADWFAKLDAHQHAVPNGFCDSLTAELKGARAVLELVSCAVVRALELKPGTTSKLPV